MAPASQISDPAQFEAALKQAKGALQNGRFADACEHARQILSCDPDHLDALYISAVASRYLKDFEHAGSTIEHLIRAHPHYARGHQEKGHLAAAQGDKPGAAHAFRHAVDLNPALHASWKALADISSASGDSEIALRSRAQYERLSALPPELISVTSFLHEGQLLKAERLCRAFLQKTPHHVEAMRLLAQLGVKLHVLDDAEFLLESCLELRPDYILARIDYIDVLQKRQNYAKAREQADHLLATDPDNPGFQFIAANAAMAVGDYDTALNMFERVLERSFDPASVHMSRGHALKTVGRQEDAVTAYRAAYSARPSYGDAFWSLANLKTYRFTDDEMARMEGAAEDPATALADRYHLHFALGKACEDEGDYARAFKYYESGNALKKQELRYDPERMNEELRRQIEACSQSLFDKQADKGCNAPDPIFIVGLPRAGSTLLEQILASHSQVDGTLELPNILATAHRLNGRRMQSDAPLYPANLHDLAADKLVELGQRYIDDTRIHRQGAAFFTDKMPNNFRHIGLIHLILPNAKIIDARREPMACCFSGFKQLFAEGQEFTYGQDEIGSYYRAYVDLMDHWDRVLPGKVLRVHYEDVVGDLEGQVRRMLEFCGLPLEATCLDFHKTERSVRTASSEQVRQPINRAGLEQWRHFEDFLDPLKHALGPALTTYRAETTGPANHS